MHFFIVFWCYFCSIFCSIFPQKTIKKRPIMKLPQQLGLQNLTALSFGGSAKYKIRYACTMYEIKITSWKFHPYHAAGRACQRFPSEHACFAVHLNMPNAFFSFVAEVLLRMSPLTQPHQNFRLYRMTISSQHLSSRLSAQSALFHPLLLTHPRDMEHQIQT